MSVSNANLFLFHEQAFLDTQTVINAIGSRVAKSCGTRMTFVEVKANDVSLKTSIDTYLFNSQIVTLPSGEIALIAPSECQENARTKAYIEDMVKRPDIPIKTVHYLNLRQSMRNGGGSACLRLRVVLTNKELGAVHPKIFLDDALYAKLTAWVKKHYRDKLHPNDLADPQLLLEVRQALDELTQILQLGNIYEFQSIGTKHG